MEEVANSANLISKVNFASGQTAHTAGAHPGSVGTRNICTPLGMGRQSIARYTPLPHPT